MLRKMQGTTPEITVRNRFKITMQAKAVKVELKIIQKDITRVMFLDNQQEPI